jgi:hypothetical protein
MYAAIGYDRITINAPKGNVMIKQDSAKNSKLIEEMIDAQLAKGMPYYWVNVENFKWFTADLAKATRFFDTYGQSMYRCDNDRKIGLLVFEVEEEESTFSVEIEFVSNNPGNDMMLPENTTDHYESREDAEELMKELTAGYFVDEYKREEMKYVDEIRVRLVNTQLDKQTVIKRLKFEIN